MLHARQRLPLLIAGAVAAAALSACTADPAGPEQGGSAGPSAEPQVTVSPQPDPANATLPLDAYSFDKAQQKVMEQAQDILTESCMRRVGFASFKNSSTYANTTAKPTTSGIGLVDAESAKKSGYRSGALPDRGSEAGTKRDPNETAALFGAQDGAPPYPGAPEGGCSGEATRKLYPKSTESGTKLLDELVQQAGDRARGDSRITAGITQWSTCMREAGFQVSNPWELQQMEGTRWTGPVTSEEITAATTDVSCKQRTKLTDTWTAVLTAYQNGLVERHKEGLDQEKKRLGEQVRFAQKVLQDGSA